MLDISKIEVSPSRWDDSMDSRSLMLADMARKCPNGGVYMPAAVSVYADGDIVITNGMHRIKAFRVAGEPALFATVTRYDAEGNETITEDEVVYV